MVPKRKSTPAWNPLGSESSSSNPPVPPLHIRFHDGKVQQDFLENFQKRGVHPERQVVLSDFSDTPSLRSLGLKAGDLFVRYL